MKKETIQTKIREFFKKAKWSYQENRARSTFSGGISLKAASAISSIRFYLTIRDQILISYAVIPQKAIRNISSVLEFLARANYGLVLGNFEIDMDDGEIRYKHCIHAAGLKEDIGPAIEELLFLPCNMIEKYGEGLLAVIYGGQSAKDAIEAIEKQ